MHEQAAYVPVYTSIEYRGWLAGHGRKKYTNCGSELASSAVAARGEEQDYCVLGNITYRKRDEPRVEGEWPEQVTSGDHAHGEGDFDAGHSVAGRHE